jgi:hypothetical protein
MPLASAAQIVPVYSNAESEEYVLRGFTRCPTYDAELTAWYAGQEFADFALASEPLLAELAAIDPTLNTNLETFENVADDFTDWRSYGVGTPMPNISAALFSEVWVTHSKRSVWYLYISVSDLYEGAPARLP